MRRRTVARVAVATSAGVAGAYAASRPTLMSWPSRVRPAVIALAVGTVTTTAYLGAGALGLRAQPATAAMRVRRAGYPQAGRGGFMKS